MKPYIYLTNCVSAKGCDIQEMKDKSRQIKYSTFIREIGAELVSEIFGFYAWKNQTGLRLKKDWSVLYYSSKYLGQRCYYIEHSCIEYIFVVQK